MKTEQDVINSIKEVSDSINLIATELLWILSVCNEKEPRPDTPLGDEMVQKFISLFKDFNGISLRLGEIENEVLYSGLDDLTKYKLLGVVDLIDKQINTGLFKEFRSMATTGQLPKDHDFHHE